MCLMYFCRLNVASNRGLQRRFADQPNLLPNCCNSKPNRRPKTRQAIIICPFGSAGRYGRWLMRVQYTRTQANKADKLVTHNPLRLNVARNPRLCESCYPRHLTYYPTAATQAKTATQAKPQKSRVVFFFFK